MKKMLFGLGVFVLGTTVFGEENHLYLKAGGNIFSRYSKYSEKGVATTEDRLTKGKTKGFGYELAIEGTRDISNNIEVGLGIAYQNNNKTKNYSFTADGVKSTTTVGKYDSVPLYVLGKYNFESINDWKPYVKMNLGYTFNINEDKTKMVYTEGNENRNYSFKTKVKNGLYFGIGAGAEYNNFLIDLTYSVNHGKAQIIEDAAKTKYQHFDFGRVILSAGYKFDF